MLHNELVANPSMIRQIGEISRKFDPTSTKIKQGFTVYVVLHLMDGSFTTDSFRMDLNNREWSDILHADDGRLSQSLEYLDDVPAAKWAILKGGKLY